MKIVIDYRPLFKNNFSVAYRQYITGAISNLQKEKPQVEFLFVVDKIPTEKLDPGVHPQQLVVKKSLPGITGWKIWYQWQIPAILQKTRSDLLITPGGIASRVTDIPQCVWWPGIQRGNYLKKKYFKWTRKKLPETLANAKIIFTNSEKNKEYLAGIDHSVHNKIILISPAPDDDAYALSWDEKEKMKTTWALGKEYFLINRPGSTLEFVNLLKAFAQFKKRQQSNMQLVITGVKGKKFSEKLQGFKYRADVHLHDDLSETTFKKIWSAAYALLQPDINISALLNSFNMHVPVITPKKEYPVEIGDDVVLYEEFAETENLAARLMLLYKEESWRNELIAKGVAISGQFSRQRQLSQLWDGVTKAINH
jgi:23S rRNA pseudoU1915 N3-methylase RlmH